MANTPPQAAQHDAQEKADHIVEQEHSVSLSGTSTEHDIVLDKRSIDQTMNPRREWIKESAKFVAWLGASVGGLIVLLVVIGFLAVSAHDAMIGIPRAIQNKEEYVAVGGLFFGRSVIFAVSSLFFPRLNSWIVVVVSLLLLTLVLISSKFRVLNTTYFAVLAFTGLICAEIYALWRLAVPLQISNLLLNISANQQGPSLQVRNAILENDVKWLSAEYGFLVLLVISLVVGVLLFEQVYRRDSSPELYRKTKWVFWYWIRIPALIFLMIALFFLPRTYGVLTISNNYPEIKDLVKSNKAESPNEGGATDPAIKPPVPEKPKTALFMLRADDKYLTLYEPSSQSIITMRHDLIEQYRVDAPQHIFTAKESK